jgi:hypothetical protein
VEDPWEPPAIGNPVLKINMIPFTTSRTLTRRLLPPSLAGGIIGSTSAHSSLVRHSDIAIFYGHIARGFSPSTSPSAPESSGRFVARVAFDKACPLQSGRCAPSAPFTHRRGDARSVGLHTLPAAPYNHTSPLSGP